MDLNPIQKQIAENRLTDDQHSILSAPYELTKIVGEHKDLDALIFDRLPQSNLSTDDYNIGFAESATDLIKDILSKDKLTDDTLVIISSNECANVMQIAVELPNVLIISQKDEISKNIFKSIDAYVPEGKNVIVYVIGTQLSTGIITPNQQFIQLKQMLQNKGCKSIFILDDVQGMFVVPRDYSIFDYVIGSCHGLVRNFNMGMVIQNNHMDQYGYSQADDEQQYISQLDILLTKLNSFDKFTDVIRQVFSDELSKEESRLFAESAPNIVAIRFSDSEGDPITFTTQQIETLSQHYIRVTIDDTTKRLEHYVCLRAQEILYHPESVLQGLMLLEQYLQSHY